MDGVSRVVRCHLFNCILGQLIREGPFHRKKLCLRWGWRTVANFHPTLLLPSESELCSEHLQLFRWNVPARLLHRPPRTLRDATNHSAQLLRGKARWKWKRIFIYETNSNKDVGATGNISTQSPPTTALTFRRNLKVRKYTKDPFQPDRKVVSKSKSREQAVWAAVPSLGCTSRVD